MYKLRTYQQSAVEATIKHFQREKTPALIVLPTGAGKSLVIAELARIAKGRVLVLAHVKELVEQNHSKYESYNLEAGIYSAGLNRKESEQKVIFGSIQSVALAAEDFFNSFTLLVIDECHRVSMEAETQYFQVISKLKDKNSGICILGLTATPYRLGSGWIYNFNSSLNTLRSSETRFFEKCIYELSISYMIKNKYLVPPVTVDSPVACYDFSSLKMVDNRYSLPEITSILKDQKRITPIIIDNIVEMAKDREGVMIFTSSVIHAREILGFLPMGSAIVTGETEENERAEIIKDFKDKKIKFLVNVSVLTTGFDAPHVDVIAILRPTESVSLYQQIIGRGLRLSPGKSDCLVLDYTGMGHNVFSPEIEEAKPSEKSELVKVSCPKCNFENVFWGIVEDGEIIEHFGRQCKGARENEDNQKISICDYRFRFKRCESCGSENDIAARVCSSCEAMLVDNDKKLKEAMSLKDAHVMRPDTMIFSQSFDKKNGERLEIRYYDFDGEFLNEYFYLNSEEKLKAFYFNFTRMHNRLPEKEIKIKNIDDVIDQSKKFRMPMFIIARKKSHFWEIREKIF